MDICSRLIELGFVEYPSRFYEGARNFSKNCLEGPECATNEEIPSLHVHVYPDMDYGGGRKLEAKAEFEVFGEEPCGTWLKAVIYSFPADMVEKELPRVIKMASATWKGFCEGANER